MNNQPLVSVVTITLNRGELLKRCIGSVLNQTYSNLEHIIVDGASTDNTDEVIASFKDTRLHYIKLPSNYDIKTTIDIGIHSSKGKYVTFLDSDDEYLPSKIQKQVELMETLPEDYGMVYCWMTYFDSKTKKKLYTHSAQLRGFVPDDVVEKPTVSGTPTIMFRREILVKLDGWKSLDEIGIDSDWELCARACQICKVDFVPESLVNVYVNHGYVRQTDGDGSAYYGCENSQRLIKFHQHFLQTFSDVFERHPKYARSHYSALCRCYSKLKDRRNAWKYYIKYLRSSPSVMGLLKGLVHIVFCK